MNAPLAAPASDRRTQVVQAETNADQSRGFVQTPHPADFRGLSDGAYRQYQWLLSYAWNGERCWPSERTLAEAQDVTARTVRTRMRELEAKGYVVSESRGPGKGNVYNLRKTVSGDRGSYLPGGRKQTSAPIEVDVGEVQAVEIPSPSLPPPVLPPTAEPRRTAAGGASRLRSKADGQRQPLTDEQRTVKEFLVSEGCEMWSGPADDLARSGTTLEAAQVAWEEVQASDRTLKPRALQVRLTENAEGYERQAEEKREEGRIEAERERRKPELDRNVRNANQVWEAARERDRTMTNLLASKTPFALARVYGCGDWYPEAIAGGRTPLGNLVRGPRGRERALLRELRAGTAPRAAVSEIERAYWQVAPEHIAKAVQAWYAVNEQQPHPMPQAAG